MRVACPTCYAEFALEAALDDEAARELMALLGGWPREFSRPLVAYVGLFRSRTRRLSWDRALRLVREVEQLTGDTDRLATALSETVEAMREKQQSGAWRPLQSHNYLNKVLETVEARPATNVTRYDASQGSPPRRTSRTVEGLESLEGQRRER